MSAFLADGGALCAQVDPEMFFPTERVPREAFAVCALCPLIAECREHALAHDVRGVWGRHDVRRARADPRAARDHRRAGRRAAPVLHHRRSGQPSPATVRKGRGGMSRAPQIPGQLDLLAQLGKHDVVVIGSTVRRNGWTVHCRTCGWSCETGTKRNGEKSASMHRVTQPW